MPRSRFAPAPSRRTLEVPAPAPTPTPTPTVYGPLPKRPRGRPPLGARKRSKRAYPRFTAQEWIIIEKCAKTYGYQDPNVFIQEILLHALKSL